MLLAVEAEKDPKKTLKEMNKRLNKVAPDIATIEQKPLKTRFLHALPDLVGVVGSLIPIFQIGKPIVEAIVKLLGGTDE